MSDVQPCAIGVAPLQSSFEGLTKRLLALRAEIDAILTELAGTAPSTTAVAEAPVEPGPSADNPTLDNTDHEIVEPNPEIVEPGPDVATLSHEPSIDSPHDSESESQVPAAASAPEASLALEPLPSEAAVAAALESEPQEGPTDGHEDLAPAAASQANPADGQDTGQPNEAAALPVAAADAAQHPQVEQGVVECAAAVAPSLATAPPTANATLHSPPARRRKQRRELAPAPAARPRAGRRIAARIAASILVLLTAATVLVMVDRDALASVRSHPWIAPLPAYLPSVSDWPFVSDWLAIGRASAPSMPADAVAPSYGEVWPAGY